MSDPVYEDIRVERDGPVSILRVHRPEARNAYRYRTLEEAIAAVDRETARGARALVIAGDEIAFSSGADLKEMRTATKEQKEDNLRIRWNPFLDRLERGAIPAIAAVRGYALAGGMEVVLACHVRFASPDAKFGLAEIRRGHIPGAGGTVRFPRLAGTGIALQYLLTGDTMDADAAFRAGVVKQVVPADDVVAHAVAFGKRVAGLSAKAVELTLRSVMAQRDLPLADALSFEMELCAEMRKHGDYQEGLDAFVQKRAPDYET